MNWILNIWNSYHYYIIAPFVFVSIIWFTLFGILKYIDTVSRQGNSNVKEDKRLSDIWWVRNSLVFIQIHCLKRRSSSPDYRLNYSPYLPKFHPVFLPLRRIILHILGRSK